MAVSDYYMTALDVGVACGIPVFDVSVCSGDSYADRDHSCQEGCAGLRCGACADGYALDAPKEPCQACSDRPGVFLMVLSMNLVLASKTALGLFLAHRAMSPDRRQQGWTQTSCASGCSG